MPFVGIRNSRAKVALLRQPAISLGEAGTERLTFDCERHLEMLGVAAGRERGKTLQDTLYWKYLRLSGLDAGSIAWRCRRFEGLLNAVMEHGYDVENGAISVTEDGIRLDGSHRVAVARFLGLDRIPVRVYAWSQLGEAFVAEATAIQREANLKRASRLRRSGTKALDRWSGKCLGTVMYEDIQPVAEKRLWLFRSVKLRPMLAVRDPSGVADFYSLDRVRGE